MRKGTGTFTHKNILAVNAVAELNVRTIVSTR